MGVDREGEEQCNTKASYPSVSSLTDCSVPWAHARDGDTIISRTDIDLSSRTGSALGHVSNTFRRVLCLS